MQENPLAALRYSVPVVDRIAKNRVEDLLQVLILVDQPVRRVTAEADINQYYYAKLKEREA